MPKTGLKGKEIGAVIANRRKELGITQEALALMIGVSGPFVGYIERGQRGTSVKTLQDLAAALQLPKNRFVDLLVTDEKTGTVTAVEVKSQETAKLKIFEPDDVQAICAQRESVRKWREGISMADQPLNRFWFTTVNDYIGFTTGAPNGQIAVRLGDNSMSPVAEEGDVVIVHLDEKPRDSDLVLAVLGENVFVRRFVQTMNTDLETKYAVTILLADNHCHAPVHLKTRDEPNVILGRVVSLIRNFSDPL